MALLQQLPSMAKDSHILEAASSTCRSLKLICFQMCCRHPRNMDGAELRASSVPSKACARAQNAAYLAYASESRVKASAWRTQPSNFVNRKKLRRSHKSRTASFTSQPWPCEALQRAKTALRPLSRSECPEAFPLVARGWRCRPIRLEVCCGLRG